MPGIAPATIARAVVLAAGLGNRLGARTADLPKPLVEVAGRPLIRHTLAGLRAAGVQEAVVVGGYRLELLREALAKQRAMPLTFVTNDRFDGGASFSLRAARTAVGEEPFLIVMSDHLLSAELLTRLLEGAAHCDAAAVVAVDTGAGWAEDYIAEATRVQLARDGSVIRIGKDIEPWQAIDSGAFVCFPEIWRFVDAAPEDCDLSTIFRLAAAKGRLQTADITGAFWYDVDTEEDLLAAEARLRTR